MAAPSPAPTTVPTAAPVTVLAAPAWLGVVPVCCNAHCRHTASSAWNCSKLFPSPGSTMTLGPEGTVAHAVRRREALIDRMVRVAVMGPRWNLHPRLRAGLYLWVILLS